LASRLIVPRELVDWLSSRPWWVAAFVAVLFVLFEIARARGRRWLLRLRLRLRAGRALEAEAWAARLLAEAGYAVVGSQVKRVYDLWVDGERMSIALRADYVVERRGLFFVAEVKSGQLAPSLETASTRRQLLEYRMAFAVDGVLLVDGEAGRVHAVVFPSMSASPPTMSRQATLAPF
jgi:hypothetical protein